MNFDKFFFNIVTLNILACTCLWASTHNEYRAAVFPGKTVILAADLPYTVTQPGIYILAEDVPNYAGPLPAITVMANLTQPVTIDLCNHFILTSATAVLANSATKVQNGIILRTLSNITLLDNLISEVENVLFAFEATGGVLLGVAISTSISGLCIIQNCSFTDINIGINVVNSGTKLLCKNCIFQNNNTSINVPANIGSNGSLVENCIFKEASARAISLQSNTSQWTVDNCIMHNSLTALTISNANDIIVTQCIFERLTNGIATTNGQRIVLNKVTMNNIGQVASINSGGSDFNLLDITANCGASGNAIIVSSATRNGIIKNLLLQQFQSSILLAAGSNFLIQSCQIKNNASGINIAGSAQTEVFNCTSMANGVGTNYTGVSPLLVSTTDADTAAAGLYFRNISR